jgi:hypothetical protein
MLIQQTRIICDAESLDEVTNHLKRISTQNGYSNLDIKYAPVLKHMSQIQKEKLAGAAMILFQQVVSNKISRLLAKRNVKTIHTLAKKSIHMLRPIKDKMGLKVAGIYCVPCKCGKVCVGETGRIIETCDTYAWVSQRSLL